MPKVNLTTGQYISQYCSTLNPGSTASVGLPVRDTNSSQKKHIKYTRSKTGCMTCRVKKIKCDEIKPICSRCTRGFRECSWPEVISARKRTPLKRDSWTTDERTSTPESIADSPGLPERSGLFPTTTLCPHYHVQGDIMNLIEDPHLTMFSPSPTISPRLRHHSLPVTRASHYITQSYDHGHSYTDPQSLLNYEVPAIYIQVTTPHANPAHWNTELGDSSPLLFPHSNNANMTNM